MKSKKVINIALLGLGTVGSGVARILLTQSKLLEKRTGTRFVLKTICAKAISKKIGVRVPKSLLTGDPWAMVNDPSIDIVIELFGGIHPAKELILQAIKSGKHVVTANKALLAENGDVFSKAAAAGCKIGFEASVCGGIPIVKSVREGLISDEIDHFLGIVNGTCNYILTEMSQRRINFNEALRQAQEEGYAEKNPSLDIDGIDSAHKLAILARLAFRRVVPYRLIPVEGIAKLSTVDIEYAAELGYAVKLLAIGKINDGNLELRVHPAMLSFKHPLSNVQGVYNAVFMHADHAGDLLFYGRGAGTMPTASAIMSDVVDIGKEIADQPKIKTAASLGLPLAKVLPIGAIRSMYYLRFQVQDKPGVLGRIALVLGKNKISILSVHQKESHDPKSVPVIILTYEAKESDLRKALKIIDLSSDVSEKTVVIRVEK